jgi:hypothetical protein
MKADLTRNTFDPFKHFTRVIMQQGRVQLDADWNEQVAILLRCLRTLAADLIGPQGGPADNCGFEISAAASQDFQIGAGHYYVDGILCEVPSTSVPISFPSANNNKQVKVSDWMVDGISFQKFHYVVVSGSSGAPPNPVVVQITDLDPSTRKLTFDTDISSFKTFSPRVRSVITYLTQPDYPVPDSEKLKAEITYLIYLDVWERHITCVEDDTIREKALGGPDTATRTKVVWQVKAVNGNVRNVKKGAKSPCDGFSPTDKSFLINLIGTNRGKLKAMAKTTSVSTDPCIISPDSRYRGPENQLYRVEIHRAGGGWDGTDNGKAGAATFKWSRENGSVVFPIVSISSSNGTTAIILKNLGRDSRLSLTEGDWVEIQDDRSVLQNRVGNLLQVQSIDRTTMTVTLSGTPDSNIGNDLTLHPLLRRWDQKEGDPTEGGLLLGTDNAALIVEDSDGLWLNLEDGVQIQFQKPDPEQPANQYRTGDYWLIPARTATGDVEWPTETAKGSQGNLVIVRIAKPPDGIKHHYAPLAVITLDAAGTVHVISKGDCRKKFNPLAQ